MVRDTSEREDRSRSDQPSRRGPEDELPRWFLIAAVTAGAIVALLLARYAIDLLGLVFVIVLVGTCIRALTDWIADTESVSAWSIAAIMVALAGTAATALWLFGSAPEGGVARVDAHLPPVLRHAVEWAEARGWGGRVLLPHSPGDAGSQPGRREGLEGVPAPRTGPGAVGSRTVEETVAPAASSESETKGAWVATSTRLTITPSSGRVGAPVQLRAEVTTEPGGAVVGTVVFRRGSIIIGAAPLGHDGGPAELTTSALPRGDHEIVAEFVGGGRFSTSRSPAVPYVVEP